MRKVRNGFILLALTAAAVAGCDDPHKGEHCAQWHTSYYYQPAHSSAGYYSTSGTTRIYHPGHFYPAYYTQDTECVQWVKDAPSASRSN